MREESTASPATLYIVATPIGNLQDITLRALSTLKQVDRIAAEDTRHTRQLLQHFGIDTPLISLHEHNERERTAALLAQLEAGQAIALVSDAGTPLISDPGFTLVREARAAGFMVTPIPGACAAVAALSASGLPTDRFSFEGFLPAKHKARCERLQGLNDSATTWVFYESTHRLRDSLQDIDATWGQSAHLVLAKELTKQFEQVVNGTAGQLIDWLNEDDKRVKGEFVLLLRLDPEQASGRDSDTVLKVLLESLPTKQAAGIAAKLTGEAKNQLYQRALELQNR